MLTFFALVGMVACAAVAVLVVAVLWYIVGNLYGAIRGIYRMRYLARRWGNEAGARPKLVPLLKYALRYWDGFGEVYWQSGAIEIPVDGRKPLRRRRWYPG